MLRAIQRCQDVRVHSWGDKVVHEISRHLVQSSVVELCVEWLPGQRALPRRCHVAVDVHVRCLGAPNGDEQGRIT